MDLNGYQKAIGHHAFYPNVGQNLYYPVLGLAGEAGEVANTVKKIMRDRREPNADDRIAIGDELGDVLWYVAAVAQEIGWSLDDVARFNLAKLEQRKQERGEPRAA